MHPLSLFGKELGRVGWFGLVLVLQNKVLMLSYRMKRYVIDAVAGHGIATSVWLWLAWFWGGLPVPPFELVE